MVLENLGGSLRNALKKIASANKIDKALVDDAVREIQRALLQADVNVKLVMQLSNTIKERALNEKPAPGMNPREHVINIVYQELINLVGPRCGYTPQEAEHNARGPAGIRKDNDGSKAGHLLPEKGGFARPSSAPTPFAPEPMTSSRRCARSRAYSFTAKGATPMPLPWPGTALRPPKSMM
jgi:hypothetical protein